LDRPLSAVSPHEAGWQSRRRPDDGTCADVLLLFGILRDLSKAVPRSRNRVVERVASSQAVKQAVSQEPGGDVREGVLRGEDRVNTAAKKCLDERW
jgi:hypothetical protein